MRKASLRKNVKWMFIGNSYYAFMQWIQLSIITKYCSTYTLGSYTLALALTAPIFLFLGLQLRAMLVTDAKKEWMFSDYFSLRFCCMILSIVIICSYLLFNKNGADIILLVAIIKMIEGFAEIFNAQQQQHEQMHFVARSLIIKGTFASFAVFIGVLYWDSLTIGLFIAVLSNILVLIFNDYRNCKPLIDEKKFLSFNITAEKKLLIKAIPLGIASGIISLNTNVSKYIIEFFSGRELQGIYSTLAYCLVIGGFVNNAIGQSFSPRLSKYYAEHKVDQFKILLRKYILFNIIMGGVLFLASLLVGKYFLRIMFSVEIAEYSDLFSTIMFSGIIVYCVSAMGYTLTAMRIFKYQPIINIIVLIVNTVLCYILVQIFSIYGAISAYIIAFSIQVVLLYFVVRKYLRVKPNRT